MGRFRVLIAFTLSMFVLLAGVLVVLPVERAAADSVELGPDGYFSALEDTDGDGQILPVIDNETGTPNSGNGNGWANTRRIVFGKTDNSQTYGGASVSGGYKTLAKGDVASEIGMSMSANHSSPPAWSKSSTTSVATTEALLWAEDEVTGALSFAASGIELNYFDYAVGQYKSNLATASDEVGSHNYSSFEQTLLRSRQLEGVCTATAGCSSGSEPVTVPAGSLSINTYKVFPLALGDVNKYLNHKNGTVDDANLACETYVDSGNSGNCANGVDGSWLRTGHWSGASGAFFTHKGGRPDSSLTKYASAGLRPAFRLNLERLLLSAHSVNQSQVLSASDSLRLTFVESGRKLTWWSGSVTGVSGSRTLSLSGDSDLGSELGWKVVDPVSNTVLGSGRTSAGGNMVLPESAMSDESKDYDLYVWGQEDGSAAVGLTNKATEPVKTTIKGWQVKTPPSYGIELTGTTAGTLSAYRIGDYAESVFDQTGALKSVKLSTPAGVKSVLTAAAGSAGGSGVDVDNPIGWVAANWLGYPTDPLSDDVTSAFSPFAGKLQLFARELAGKSDAELGGVKGSLPAGTFNSLTTETLDVSGPGLYLIVDSAQSSGGSLPIIVGTRVFNEDLGDEGRFVDFVDAGVKGKPRLGQAVLKTTVTDVAKRIVNDAGLDGFDVGSQVEYEIALQVPDLSGFSSVSYAAYEFAVADVAESGLTLPAASEVKVLVDVPSPDTEVTAQVSVGRTTTVNPDDTLTVAGLKAVFAEDSGGRVANKAALPAGSLMRIRYTAVLNANASFSAPGGGALDPNANTVTLTRSYTGSVTAGWTDNSDGTESRSATANAYTFKLDLVKVDKDDTSKALGDASFEVSRDGQALKFTQVSAGVYRLDAAGGTEVTTHTDGTLSLLGVEARELSFRETTAPSGYFKVSDFMVEVVPVWNADASEVTVASYRTSGSSLAYVSQDGRSVVVADPAHSLANLPYTGGVGILLLLVIGGVFLMVAVRPYYLSHRAEATANILI
jgi:fimbrial isopeptide formation D2 family protein